MSYALLRQGDHLPSVGVLQKLLNRTGATLIADGAFGNNTRGAVTTFQRDRHMGADGVVGQQTWPRVVASEPLPIVDCVDVFDPSLYQLEVQDIQNAGGHPIIIGGMSNGVEQLVSEIVGRARNVFMLRFHGHGASGVAGMSMGQMGSGLRHRAGIGPQNLEIMLPILRRLRPIFGAYGCVQFMHCSTGKGPQGRQVLQQIANHLGVPVSAGTIDQLGGGLNTFRFEGPTFTAVPGGASLAGWCGALPDFVGMSVP